MTPERQKLIDEAGALQDKLAPFEADLKRRETLKKAIRGWPAADKTGAGESVSYTGKKYVVTLGAQENQRKIRSLAEVFKAVGRTRFIAACSLTLTALTELVGEVRAADFVAEERTGSRTLTVAKL